MSKSSKTVPSGLSSAEIRVARSNGAAPAIAVSPRLAERRSMRITIRGTAPLLYNRMRDQDLADMLKKQMTGSKPPRRKKDPEALALAGIHFIGKPAGTMADVSKARIGFPAVALKKAMVRAAQRLGEKMTEVGCDFFICGTVNGLVEIIQDGEPAEVWNDLVRMNGKQANIACRAAIPAWHAEVSINYYTSNLKADQIVSMLQRAGDLGIGAWRIVSGPDKFGWCGSFDVADVRKPEDEDAPSQN